VLCWERSILGCVFSLHQGGSLSRMPNLWILLLTLLSPAADLIEVETASLAGGILHVAAHTVATTAICPRCGTLSRRVHSHYTRTLADLPCGGVPIRITLQVRRFFCDVPTCSQRTFAERLPTAAPPYARRTTRLSAALVPLAFTAGGKPGAGLAQTLRMRVSRQTLLRLIRRTPCTPGSHVWAGAPRVVGVDDWAWKRGHRYGTLVCDLEGRRPLDLLPEREAASTAAWLAAHPSISVVSRDRGGVYAEAAAQGAPKAVQVADRWHLLKNLGDGLEWFLRRTRVHLPSVERVAAGTGRGGHADYADDHELGPTSGARALPSRRQERFAQVHAQYRAGVSIRAIAAEYGMARNTVRRYLRATHVPDWQRSSRRTRLDPYRAYLLERWNAGCHNGSQLFREIRERGYPGGSSQLGVFIARLRAHLPATAPLTPAPRPPSPRDLRWLLVRRPDELDDEDRLQLQKLLAGYPDVVTAYELVQRFSAMVRERRAADLEVWLADAAACGIGELAGFALGIRRDRAAVEAGLTLPWSQGQVEGQITRLKLLKRQMYGRAGFDLLRQRVLYRAEAV
jgi:transposase